MNAQLSFCMVAMLVAIPAAADATVVVANYTLYNKVFTVSNADLLQTSLDYPFGLGDFRREGVFGIGALTDGGFGNVGNPGPGGPAATADASNTLYYVLDRGYDLTAIDTYAGWDQSRGGQSYTVSYATYAEPTKFITLASVYNDAHGGWDYISTRANITRTSGFLARNVWTVKFQFNSDLRNGYAGYREIDVFGSAVPEPASWALMIIGFGLVGVSARRRRVSVAA